MASFVQYHALKDILIKFEKFHKIGAMYDSVFQKNEIGEKIKSHLAF